MFIFYFVFVCLLLFFFFFVGEENCNDGLYHCITKENLDPVVVKVDERKKRNQTTERFIDYPLVSSRREKEREYRNTR